MLYNLLVCRKILDYHFIHLSYIWYTWIKMYIKHLFTLFKGRTPFEVVLLLLTHWISYSWGNGDCSSYIPSDFLISSKRPEKNGAFFFLSYHDFPLYHVFLKRKNNTLEIFFLMYFCWTQASEINWKNVYYW